LSATAFVVVFLPLSLASAIAPRGVGVAPVRGAIADASGTLKSQRNRGCQRQKQKTKSRRRQSRKRKSGESKRPAARRAKKQKKLTSIP
jgi:hypothetical protein